MTICINFQYPFKRKLHRKFEENWPRGFRGEVVQRCGWMDGRSTDGQQMTTDDGWQVITTAHPEPCTDELKKN